jgi:uncharacterized HAD superfamily protein
MRDIVALDLDGVLANTEFVIDKYLKDNFNYAVTDEDLVSYKLEDCPAIPEGAVDKFLDEFYNGKIANTILPYNYSEHALNKLLNEGFKVIIITSRPISMQKLTLDWLDRWGLRYDTIYHIKSLRKHTLIKELKAKAFVEDRSDILDSIVQNCGVLEYGLFLVDHPWNEKYDKENIVKTVNISEAVDRIVEYRKWKNFFVAKCQGDIDKFIKGYFDGK